MSMLPHYIHIVNPKLKHIYLSFNEEGELVIKSPRVSQRSIEKLLIKKASWISNSRKKLEQKKGKKVNFKHKPELYFLGMSYPLVLHPYDKKSTKLTFNGESFKLFYHHYNEELFEKKIDHFYRQAAENHIPKVVTHWSTKMNLSPVAVNFRKTKRQWGSCSAKNTLSFNTMMMKLPLDVIQYIVIHELAHIRHKHHKKTFWLLVAHYMPEYKNQVQILKSFTT